MILLGILFLSCVCLVYIVATSNFKIIYHKNLDYNLAKEFEKENWIRERIYQYRLGYYKLEDFDYLKEDFNVDVEKHCGNSGERAAAESEYETLL